MPILLKRKNGEITPFRNAEYISAFYFIPKSILDKCGEEINSIPRNPRKLLQDRREKYAKDAQPDVLVTLIQSFVERIYIVDKNDERYCHIFIKGCTKEDYDEFFRATGYISGARETGTITSKLYLCDLDECCKDYMIFAIPCCMCYTIPVDFHN